jgi:hypothetical protein
MNNTLHTPGPWHTVTAMDIIGLRDILAPGDSNGIFVASNANESNARLISAAPDLLSALEFLLADYIAINGEKLTSSSVPADKARETLRKAKGEA